MEITIYDFWRILKFHSIFWIFLPIYSRLTDFVLVFLARFLAHLVLRNQSQNSLLKSPLPVLNSYENFTKNNEILTLINDVIFNISVKKDFAFFKYFQIVSFWIIGILSELVYQKRCGKWKIKEKLQRICAQTQLQSNFLKHSRCGEEFFGTFDVFFDIFDGRRIVERIAVKQVEVVFDVGSVWLCRAADCWNRSCNRSPIDTHQVESFLNS